MPRRKKGSGNEKGGEFSALGKKPPLGELMYLADLIAQEPGFEWLAMLQPDAWKFEAEFRRVCEEDLYFFAKYANGMKDLVAHLHGRVARWLTDPANGKAKLLMLPFGHLKTSLATHSQTIHFLIQPAEHNIYMPGEPGNESRLLIGCENEAKAKENLDMVKQQLARNPIIRWLWPHVCWENPKTQAPRWADYMIEVPRNRIRAEPTITAIGTGTGVMQRHYDAMWLDDIIGQEAQESVIAMQRAKNWRHAIITRGHIPTDHWEFGIGTHWSNDDVYVEWKKELPPENVMCMGALEDGQPVWPERYSHEKLMEIKRRVGDSMFTLGYMNRPISGTFSALEWEALRQYRMEEDEDGRYWVGFTELGKDDALKSRADNWAGLVALRRGDPVSLAYPVRPRQTVGSRWNPDFVEFMRERYPEKFEAAEEARRRREGR